LNTVSKPEQLKIPVIRGQVLGITVLRGYTRLCDIASISKPDIYDQKKNPTGTQRDLNPKHAKAAYEYVKLRALAFWPEVFLCVRDRGAVQYLPTEADSDFGTLLINLDMLRNSVKVVISRVDGNHRLHYGDGSQEGFEPIERPVSFCLAYELSLEQEIILFRDINNNQRRMNTSHLDNIEARLTSDETQKREHPDLYIAQKLGRDNTSPISGLVYEGGKKNVGQIIPLRTLRTGIQYMLSRPTKLTALGDAEAQYKVIRNYFEAIQKWQPQAWGEPTRYLVLRGSGLWGICFIGADVIDRVLKQGKFSAEDMVEILKSGKDWDWSNSGDFQGYGGRGGATKICDKVTQEFVDASGVSLRDLHRAIMNE